MLSVKQVNFGTNKSVDEIADEAEQALASGQIK